MGECPSGGSYVIFMAAARCIIPFAVLSFLFFSLSLYITGTRARQGEDRGGGRG